MVRLDPVACRLRKKHQHFPNVRIATINRLLLLGYPYEHIARMLGISPRTLERYCLRHNIPYRRSDLINAILTYLESHTKQEAARRFRVSVRYINRLLEKLGQK